MGHQGNARWWLGAGAELDDGAAVAFGGAIGGGGLEECGRGFALGGDFLAEFAAGFGFAIEGLGDRGGAADVAEGEDFDVEVSAVVGDVEHVSGVEFAGRLGGLSVDLDAAEVTGAGGEGTGFEESCGPEPLVNADRGHESFSYKRAGGREERQVENKIKSMKPTSDERRQIWGARPELVRQLIPE